MTDTNLNDIFVGQNFMTPEVLEYGFIKENHVAFELSTGTDFDQKPIFGNMFGVTVAIKEKHFRWNQTEHQWNKVFETIGEARDYINELKEHFK